MYVVMVFVFLVGFCVPFSSAKEVEGLPEKRDNVTSLIVVDPTLTIEKTEDGRILPVVDAKELTITQLDKVLQNMNVSNDLLSKMPLELKQKVISRGGVVVPITTKKNEYFRTTDGSRLLVTEENKEEIEKIKQQQVAKLNRTNNETTITPFGTGSAGSGSFTGFSMLQYVGSTSTEYEYDYTEWFFYDDDVQQKYTDKIAHAWQSHTTSVGREASASYRVLDYWSSWTPPTSHNTSVTGSSASISIPNTLFSEMYGYFGETVRIPKTNEGLTGKWVVKYAHPWTLLSPSIAIGPVTINFSAFLGDEWEWENTFTIGG